MVLCKRRRRAFPQRPRLWQPAERTTLRSRYSTVTVGTCTPASFHSLASRSAKLGFCGGTGREG